MHWLANVPYSIFIFLVLLIYLFNVHRYNTRENNITKGNSMAATQVTKDLCTIGRRRAIPLRYLALLRVVLLKIINSCESTPSRSGGGWGGR